MSGPATGVNPGGAADDHEAGVRRGADDAATGAAGRRTRLLSGRGRIAGTDPGTRWRTDRVTGRARRRAQVADRGSAAARAAGTASWLGTRRRWHRAE